MIRQWALLVLSGLAAAQAVAPAQPPSRGDQWLQRPVDERTFKGYLDFFAYDRTLPLDMKESAQADEEGLRREHVTYQSTAGTTVTALLWQPPGKVSSRPGIVLLHGGTPDGKDGGGMVRTQMLFARAGFTVLAIDMPYFGERANGFLNTFSEQEKHDKLYNQPAAYLAWVTQLSKDVSRGYDLLVGTRGVDPKRVVLAGRSRGAIAAAIAGAVDRRFAAVALLFGGHYDGLENNHLPAACPANYVTRISPRPLLMVNGVDDSDMIQATSVEPLFKLAKEPKQIMWTAGGHMFMTDENWAAVVQWLRDKTR